jgi:glycerol-3-phosphate dehydrogenase (NAD(P)+)
MARPDVAVIGGGAWGLALAGAAARTGGTTLLLSRRAHDGALPAGVTLARDERDVAERARLILLAVPSGVAREVARTLGAHLDGGHFVVHGVRGLVGEAMESISSVVRDETPVRRLGALGGPALAACSRRSAAPRCASMPPTISSASSGRARS